MKYKIHWFLQDSGKEIIEAKTDEEARRKFAEIPLEALLGCSHNIADIGSIYPVFNCPECGGEAKALSDALGDVAIIYCPKCNLMTSAEV